MKESNDTIPSLLNPFSKFKVGKHSIVLPEVDCLAMAIVYKGKMYGGFVNINFNIPDETKNKENIDRYFNFLVKSGKNQINKLKGVNGWKK